MAADPVLDEQMILDTLAHKINHKTSPFIQQAAMASTIDGFDRKVLRGPFIEIAETSFLLKDALARRDLISSIDELFRSGDLKQASIDEAIEGLTKTAELARTKLLSLMKDVAQCPGTEDKIN
jgi:hypothetical protein